MRGNYKAAIAGVSKMYENRNYQLEETEAVRILSIAFGRPMEHIARDVLKLRQREFVKNAHYHASQKYPIPKP